MDFKGIKADLKGLKPDMRPKSLLKLAFVPRFGSAFKSVYDIFGIFVATIAQVFVDAKLIDANHPVVLKQVKGLNAFWLLLVDGSARLKFKKDSIPQLVIFYAVVLLVVLSVLGTITFILHALLGSAMAQTVTPAAGALGGNGQSLFTVAAGNDDASTWVSQMLPYTGSGGNALAKTVGTALVMFNSGILVLASILVGWTVINVVTEVAHHGKNERHDEIHAPVRIALALALLIPVTNGYNVGQVIAIKLATAGSALATNIWANFSDKLAQNIIAPPANKNIADFLATAFIDYTCMQAVVQTSSGSGSGTANNYSAPASSGDSGFGHVYFNKDGSASRANTPDAYCGKLKIPEPEPPQGVSAFDLTAAYMAAWNATQPLIQSSAAKLSKAVATSKATAAEDFGGLTSAEWVRILTTYNTSLTNSITKSGSQITKALNSKTTYKGWITAPLLLMRLSNVSGDFENAAQLIPTGEIPNQEILPSNLRSDHKDPCESSKGFWSSLFGTEAYPCSADGKVTTASIKIAEDYITAAQQQMEASTSKATSSLPTTSVEASPGIGDIGGQIAKIFSVTSVLNFMSSGPKTGNTFGAAFMGLITTGHVLLGISAALLALGAVVGAIPFGMGQTAGLEVAAIGALVWPLGIMLGILLPLLPVTRFIFGILGWLLTLCEAMVAIPIVALVHMRSDGKGLFAHGQQAFLFLLQMMLRPALMIFGLIFSFLVFDILVSFINAMVAGTLDASTSNGFTEALSFLGFLYFYATFMYAFGNICFSAINQIPDHLLQWIGSQGIATQVAPQDTIPAPVGLRGQRNPSGGGQEQGQVRNTSGGQERLPGGSVPTSQGVAAVALAPPVPPAPPPPGPAGAKGDKGEEGKPGAKAAPPKVDDKTRPQTNLPRGGSGVSEGGGQRLAEERDPNDHLIASPGGPHNP